MAEEIRSDLEIQIQMVASLRHLAQQARAAHMESRAAWENENRVIIMAANDLEERVEEAEGILRELTLRVYAQTGNKSPAEGVGIREVTKLEYDAKTALSWAKAHEMALKLDTVAFEKIMKAEPAEFVRIYQEPQATINTTLPVEMTPLAEEK